MALNTLWFRLSLLAFMLPVSAAIAAEDHMTDVQQQSTIPYVTGGIGKTEREALQASKTEYNLHIMNADKTGHLYGDTHIIISDAQHNVLLDTPSGPIFYASLPKGRYFVKSLRGEQSREQKVTVATGTRSLRFVWPDEISTVIND